LFEILVVLLGLAGHKSPRLLLVVDQQSIFDASLNEKPDDESGFVFTF
jgi:hypothetical protein